MVKMCKVRPDTGVNFFNDLKKKYDYNTAWDLWGLCQTDNFKKRESISYNADGFPSSMDEFLKTGYVEAFIGHDKVLQGLSDKFPKLDNTRDNYDKLIVQAHDFNDSEANRDYIAIVEQDRKNPEKITINLADRNLTNERQASDQYSTRILNMRLSDILSDIGITPGNISDAELKAGRVGVTDFTKAKNLANDCASVIRVANNLEGYKALGEEFSHLIIGSYREEPLIRRALMLLEDPDTLQAILGDEYEATLDFQNGDLSLVAEEALGKLLRENLLAESSGAPRNVQYILNRLFNNIKGRFKKIDVHRIEEAIIEADSMMGQLAKDILKGQAKIKREKIAQAERNAQFNALSDRIQADIDILNKLKGIEIKRLKISTNLSAQEIQNQKDLIRHLGDITNGEDDIDTRIGLYNYALQATQQLQNVYNALTKKYFTGAPSFATIRWARSYVQSYAAFVNDIQNALIAAEKDEEVPEYFKDFELPDGTTVSMKDAINPLYILQKDIIARYNDYTKTMLADFFRPFFGDKIADTMGNTKTVEDLVASADKDITMLDLFLQSMAESGDQYLQIMDAVVKQAHDKARNDTISTSKLITRMRLEAESHGITDFEWMFEKDSKGNKTGNYISQYNVGEYQRAKEEFAKSLDKRYGEKPETKEDARLKYRAYMKWLEENADAMDANYPAAIEKWENKDYTDAIQDPAKKALYEQFIELKHKADGAYPDNRVNGIRAIQRRKSSGNRIIESLSNPTTLWANIKNQLAEDFTEQEDDDQLFGNKKNSLTNFDGTEYMALPVLYNNVLKNPNELSTDIFSDLLTYTHASNIYKHMAEVVDPLETARNWIVDKQRKIPETRGGVQVQEVLENAGERVSNVIIKGSNNIERKVNEFMESGVYQRYMKDAGAFKLFGKSFSRNKIGSWILKMGSMANLGFNFLANSANVATGAAMMNIEAAGGEYFNAKDLLKADSVYGRYLPEYIKELGSRNKTNFLSLLDDFLNIKADYDEKIQRNQKKNWLQKLFGENIQFLGQEGGDHWLYHRAALAFLSKKKVYVPKEERKISKVKGIDGAIEAVKEILYNSELMQLVEEADRSYYLNTTNGAESARVTQVSNPDKEVDENWGTPSTNIGTGFDELVRDFFSDLLIKNSDGHWIHDTLGDKLTDIYPNATQEDIEKFIDQLVDLKEKVFDANGLTPISRDVVARGKLKIIKNGVVQELPVAGTLDILAYDKQGNFYIFDMKTHRNKKISEEKKRGWSRQLSLYKRFLEEEYGIKVNGINIIPIKVDYPTPEGMVSDGEVGTTVYTVKDADSHQLYADGNEFRDAHPDLGSVIPLQYTDKVPIEYDNLGYNKQYIKESNFGNYDQMSLLEALRIKNSFSDRDDIKEMYLPEGILDENGLPINKDLISRQIQDMQHDLFGVYNQEDFNVAQKYILGKALLQYRQWIVPQFTHRFGTAKYDVRTGKFKEGYYITLGKFMAKKFLYNLMNEGLRGKIQIAEHWNELTLEEKQNIKKALFEIIQCFCIWLIANYAPWPDDKERPWAIKYAEYMAKREVHELAMLTPFAPQAITLKELQKTATSPMAVMSTIGRTINFAASVLTPEDWMDEKQSGPYKGMSSLEANFLKAPIPAITWWKQIERFGDEIDYSIDFYARSNVQ